MLEIGAARPKYLSIGASFRNKGWRVISIEPNSTFASQHRELGHEIHEYACGDSDEDDVDFVIAEGDGLTILEKVLRRNRSPHSAFVAITRIFYLSCKNILL